MDLDQLLIKENWVEHAKCAEPDNYPLGYNEDVFTSWQQQDKKVALEICGTCDVREECLDFALSNNQDIGIWGGLQEEERKELLRGRTRRTQKRMIA